MFPDEISSGPLWNFLKWQQGKSKTLPSVFKEPVKWKKKSTKQYYSFIYIKKKNLKDVPIQVNRIHSILWINDGWAELLWREGRVCCSRGCFLSDPKAIIKQKQSADPNSSLGWRGVDEEAGPPLVTTGRPFQHHSFLKWWEVHVLEWRNVMLTLG